MTSKRSDVWPFFTAIWLMYFFIDVARHESLGMIGIDVLAFAWNAYEWRKQRRLYGA